MMPTATATRQRLYQMDLLRVVTFTCVVFVHSYGAMNNGAQPHMAALSILMHFTRYAFVFITAFVLFYGYYHRDESAPTFWRKRFGAVAMPYVVWTLIYTFVGFTIAGPETIAEAIKVPVANLVLGTGWFHLYFLLVSMQLYALFPLLKTVVRRTTGHHGVLLGVAFAVQVAIFCLFTYVTVPQNAIGSKIWFLQSTIVISYTFFAVLGALMAVHHERVRAYVLGHLPLFGAAFVVGLGVTLAIFLHRIHGGLSPDRATSPTHPSILPWLIGSVLGLYAFCTWWSTRRDPSSPLARTVDYGSLRAFGLYAIHPLMIQLQWAPWHDSLSDFFDNDIVAGLFLFVTTTALSLLLTEVLLRSPLSKTLVARTRLVTV